MFLEANPCFQKAHVFCMDLQPAADPYNVVCSASVHTHINSPKQSACGPTTAAVRRVDVHQCQGHEIAPDAA